MPTEPVLPEAELRQRAIERIADWPTACAAFDDCSLPLGVAARVCLAPERRINEPKAGLTDASALSASIAVAPGAEGCTWVQIPGWHLPTAPAACHRNVTRGQGCRSRSAPPSAAHTAAMNAPTTIDSAAKIAAIAEA